MQDAIEIGYVARSHGIRGELRIVLHNPESTALSPGLNLLIGGTEHRIASLRPVGGAWLVKLETVADRSAADGWRGKTVAVHRSDLVLDENEHLLADLVGCQLETRDGRPYGCIASVHHGVQDRLVIHDGSLERELPLVEAFVLEIDLEARRVIVDPPEGLPEWSRED